MSRFVMKLVTALLPPTRKAWGQAMQSEYLYLERGQNNFAWGCLATCARDNFFSGPGIARIALLTIALLMAVRLSKALQPFLLYAAGAPANSNIILPYLAGPFLKPLVPVLCLAGVTWYLFQTSLDKIRPPSISSLINKILLFILLFQALTVFQIEVSSYVLTFHSSKADLWLKAIPALPSFVIGIACCVLGWNSTARMAAVAIIGAMTITAFGWTIPSYIEWSTQPIQPTGELNTYLSPAMFLTIGLVAALNHLWLRWATSSFRARSH